METYLRQIKWILIESLFEHGVKLDSWGHDAIIKTLRDVYHMGLAKGMLNAMQIYEDARKNFPGGLT